MRYGGLKKRILALCDKLEEDEAEELRGEEGKGVDGDGAAGRIKEPSFLSLPDLSNTKTKPRLNTGVSIISSRPPPRQSSPRPAQADSSLKPQISLQRARLPTFSGDMRDYYRWRSEWEDLQELGNPEGVECIAKFHLLNSLDEKVKKELVLTSCGSTKDIFKLLDNKYGNKAKIVLLITNEVQSLPPIKGNNPRKTIELIQAVERALCSLQILGEEDAVKKPHCCSIARKQVA